MKNRAFWGVLTIVLGLIFLYQNLTPFDEKTLTPQSPFEETVSSNSNVEFVSCQNETQSATIITLQKLSAGTTVIGTVGEFNFEGQLPITIGTCVTPAVGNEIKICRPLALNDYLKFAVKGPDIEVNTEFMTINSCELAPMHYEYN